MLAIERQSSTDVASCILPLAGGARVWVALACDILRLEPRTAVGGLKLYQPSLELHGHRAAITALLAYERTLWSGSMDGTLRRWDVESGVCLGVLAERVKTFSLLRVGKLVLSGGSDHAVNMWDAQTGKRLTSLTKHTDVVSSMVLVWNDTIWSASWDRSICIWV